MSDDRFENVPPVGPHTITAAEHPHYAWIEMQRKACEAGRCRWRNPADRKPPAALSGDCVGFAGVIRKISGDLQTIYHRCARFTAWVEARGTQSAEAKSPAKPPPDGWA